MHIDTGTSLCEEQTILTSHDNSNSELHFVSKFALYSSTKVLNQFLNWFPSITVEEKNIGDITIAL